MKEWWMYGDEKQQCVKDFWKGRNGNLQGKRGKSKRVKKDVDSDDESCIFINEERHKCLSSIQINRK